MQPWTEALPKRLFSGSVHAAPGWDNQISRKLGIFDRKLEGNHSIFHCYSDIYYNKEAI